MKKKFLLTFFLLSYIFSFAQISSVTYANNQDNLLTQIVKKKDGNYLVVINALNKMVSSNTVYCKIFEMNPNGKFIDSTIISRDTDDFSITRLIPVSNSYIAIASTRSKLNSVYYTSIIFYDKQLKNIRDTIIPSRSINMPSFAFDKDSNIIFSMSNIPGINYFGKIDKLGYLKSWKIDSSNLGLSEHSLIVRKDSLLYTLFLNNRFVTFDTAFNKIHESKDAFRNNVSLGSNLSIRTLNDSTVCMAGKGVSYPISANVYSHFLGITTLSGRTIFSKIYSAGIDTAIWGAWSYNSDTTKLGDWYWGGTHNLIYAASFRALAQSSFILHKLNRDYSTKWTKKYGGDAYYELIGVLATDDGGCMMYGTRYDYNSIPKYDAYILKVNADGLKTSESFIPIALHSIDIYPNPSSGWVNFDFKEPLSDGHIRVMDAQGRLVHQAKLQENISATLDLSFLNNGVYFIQIFEKNRLFAANKWIKKSE